MIAKAYDNPIPGFKTPTVGNLRLWEALPVEEFDLSAFNEGKYDKVSRLSTRRSLWPVSRENLRPSATNGWIALVSFVPETGPWHIQRQALRANTIVQAVGVSDSHALDTVSRLHIGHVPCSPPRLKVVLRSCVGCGGVAEDGGQESRAVPHARIFLSAPAEKWSFFQCLPTTSMRQLL